MNLTKLITTAKIKKFIKLKFFVFRLYIYNTKYKYYFPGKIKQRYCTNITVNNRLLVVADLIPKTKIFACRSCNLYFYSL